MRLFAVQPPAVDLVTAEALLWGAPVTSPLLPLSPLATGGNLDCALSGARQCAAGGQDLSGLHTCPSGAAPVLLRWDSRPPPGQAWPASRPSVARLLAELDSPVCLPAPSCLRCSILHTLRVRYSLDSIYTYSGNILIAVRGAGLGRFGGVPGPGCGSLRSLASGSRCRKCWRAAPPCRGGARLFAAGARQHRQVPDLRLPCPASACRPTRTSGCASCTGPA